MRLWLARVLCGVMLLALAVDADCFAQSAPIEDLGSFPHGSLQIARGAHKAHFDIWIADTPTRQEQGLMFVRDLPAARGMLFPLGRPRVANFWMKNTYIELDLLFIKPDGRVAKIIERAQPFLLNNLSSDQPVSAVLEIKGGEAAQLGLRSGDLVTWSQAGPGSPSSP